MDGKDEKSKTVHVFAHLGSVFRYTSCTDNVRVGGLVGRYHSVRVPVPTRWIGAGTTAACKCRMGYISCSCVLLFLCFPFSSISFGIFACRPAHTHVEPNRVKSKNGLVGVSVESSRRNMRKECTICAQALWGFRCEDIGSENMIDLRYRR